MVMFLVLAAVAAQPSTQALRLGKVAAESGELATMLPMLEAKETQELVGDHPDLAPAEKERLKTIAHAVYVEGRERLLAATATAYARHLSVEDLRQLIAFRQSAAGKRYVAAMPSIILESSQAAGKLDFKGDVIAAYCKQTGQLCSK